MPFRNMDLWMERTDCLDAGEMSYNASARIGSKRANQWLIDNAEAGFFPNKRQAVGILYNNTVQEAGSRNVSLWENASNVDPDCSQFSGKICGSPASGEINVDEESIPSSRIENLNMHAGRKLIEDTFGMDSPFSLSMSHAVGDLQQGFNHGGLRKVKVSEVKDCKNQSVLEEHPYDTGCKSAISLHSYNKENHSIMPTALSYPGGNSHVFSVGGSASREGSGFMLMNLQYRKQGENFPIGEPYSAEDSNVSMVDARKGNSNTVSVSPMFTKDNSTGTCVGVDYKKDDSIFSLAEASLSLNNAHNRTVSLDHSRTKFDDNNLAVGHNGESNIISFGGFHDDEANFSGRNICNYDLFFDQTKQPFTKKAEILNNMNPTDLETHANAAVGQHETVSVNECSLKKQDQQKLTKKLPQNNFPSNVRSLLSTGMLDGVPVKYIAWSREKELQAVIKGSGYLCGCEACSFSKVINAYEFERHAGCKTKHPNNHIYFENGKTIYGIVQELRSTSQDMLFDVIQTITGSPLNQKSFRLWKESFLAATRELQRIYGKDE